MLAQSRAPAIPPSHDHDSDSSNGHYSRPASLDARSNVSLSLSEGENAYELQPLSSENSKRHGGAVEDDEEPGSAMLKPRRLSLSSIQSYELYTPDEDRSVRRKLDRRLVGFMALLYMLSFLDRSNIGNARIAGLSEDLNLSSKQFGWLLWAFYITYIIFEWMTLMYRLVPAHIYISLCILSWGIIASGQAIATSFPVLLILRALLGIGEAAFGPGVPFYLSFFFRRNELALRTGLFISASPLSASFAGALAWLITTLGEEGPIRPWRLLFLLEGFPSVIVAVWAWSFVPDGPGTARWLTTREKEVAVLRLRKEREESEEQSEREKFRRTSETPRGVNFSEVLQTLKDPKSYITAFMFFSCNVAFSSMPVFMPTIIREMGYSSIHAQALSAPPYLFAFAVVISTAYLSDRHRSRSMPLIFHSLLACMGYSILTITGYYKMPDTTIRYIALYFATAGFFSAITIIITWTINNQESDSKKGTGMAILNVIGQTGPLVGTSIFPREDGPWYFKGMAICAAFMLVVCILTVILRLVLQKQNQNKREERSAVYAGVPLEEGGLTMVLPSCTNMDAPRSDSQSRERTDSIAASITVTESSFPDRGSESTVDSPLTSAADPGELPSSDFKPEADLEKAPGVQRGATEPTKFGGEEEDPAVLVSYARSGSPSAMQRSTVETVHKGGEEVINRMHKFSLYETSTRFYLVGADIMDKHYRVLKIDRTSPPGHLNIFEDDIIYSKREMNQLLNAIDDGNKGTGGMKLKCSAWGVLGFIRFTEAYYMLLVTKRAQVAMIGGHYVYQVDGTELIPLTTGSTSRFQKDRNPEEARFLSILNNLDLNRSFYFSYSYNITRSLQQNMIHERKALNEGRVKPDPDFQDMFVWNHYLLDPARDALKNVYDWCHPIIHGYIDQSSLDIYGRRVYITIIARRSRFFAGARFLKRGTNDLGYVANDVETEQIVSDVLNTSFHAPGPRLYTSPNYTSYVQHRGSIPLYWTQDNTGVTPKPDIDLNLVDPFYTPAALHFDNLFQRYGSPVYVLNLVKARERIPRESKLLQEYKTAIDYLNQSLPQNHKIIYEAFDMSRASKTRGQDKVIRVTGFFHNGETNVDTPRVQNGVARTNCIDCLDRTNAAQFVIGKRALGRQLHALGVISGKTVEFDTDCVEIFTRMFHDHGDQIAIQYGGSHLNSSRDMMESFKRYYHNSFLDSQRQEAYNLFLGNYIFTQGQPMLWDLQTDYYLHHEDPRTWLSKIRRNYISWFTAEHLEKRVLPPLTGEWSQKKLDHGSVARHDDYWLEYYRPLALSSFLKVFAYRLNDKSGPQRPDKTIPLHPEDFSPFVVRRNRNDHHSPKKIRKGVTIVDPSSETDSGPNTAAPHLPPTSTDYDSPTTHSILRESHFETELPLSAPTPRPAYPSLTTSSSTGFGSGAPRNFVPADKALMNQWTLTQFYENSLNPSVSLGEQDEYRRYIEHPLNLPLVVSSETASADDPSALEYYEYLNMGEEQCDGLGSGPAHVEKEPAIQPFDGPNRNEADMSSRRASVASIPFSLMSEKFTVPPEDIEEFETYLRVEENPLDVRDEDRQKKRYKAYRQWLRGKSFFKQSKVDPEWRAQLVGR
ncbi:uncharacterized protein EI97DRAFT_494506 [Westerdykella ornata]|uniref:SAC domain-containing protein n=1 Tax=Westerdykella ornata TaxID=318751 RepID=A0A6A6JGJ7_WESOR|nr:uncharacterized protein EI97DRAFT_494506 [Westerdykella ornata]KAF2275542.1 hypothetical protein EI97DRAFT_494506 [Westerdykella ornata]